MRDQHEVSAIGGSPTPPRAPYIRSRITSSIHGCMPPGFGGCWPRAGLDPKAARFAELLNAESEQFRALWKEHEVGVMPKEMKRFRHPEVGLLELNCQILLDPVESTSLLVYTAVPGSESYEKLQLLAIIGASPSPGR